MKNLAWMGIGAAILGAAFLLHAPYVAFSIYAFLLLVVLANLSTRIWLVGLEGHRTLDRTLLHQGEEVHVSVAVENTRGWPIPWIFLEDFYPRFCHRKGENSRLAVLMPGQRAEFAYTLTCPERGYHRIGPLLMETGDLFGLQKRFKTGAQQDYISVLPTIAYIETFSISSKRPQGPVRTTNRIYEDPTRIAGLREYTPGDPLNRVDWKATARTGQIFTRVYDPTSITGGTLILDFHDDDYVPEDKAARMELAITTTASIAYLLQMSGEQTGMLTNALDAAELARYEAEVKRSLSREDIDRIVSEQDTSDRIRPLQVPTLKTPVQALKIAENLARVVPGHGLDMVELLMAEYRGLPRDAALLPVVPQVSERLALTLAELKYMGFAVSVFLIRAGRHYEEAAALLAPHYIHVFHIREESDLHELAPQKIGA